MPIKTTDAVLAGASALLLVLSFPDYNLGFLAWVALVPLLMALDGKGPKVTLLLCYVTGVLAFGGIFSWFWYVTEVTLLDILLINGCLGLNVALWGVRVWWIRTRTSWPLALVAQP